MNTLEVDELTSEENAAAENQPTIISIVNGKK